MASYYNEIDPFAAQWLRNLIDKNLIAPGDVDTRSIEDVRPDDLRTYTQCHFFAGIGVWSHALRQAGWPDDREVWTGSPPCQPFSDIGKKRGTEDERHLWPALFNLIKECKPSVLFGEQVEAAIKYKWLDFVLTDLEGAGYAVGSASLSACGFGAPQIRQRLFWVGDSDYSGLEGHTGNVDQGWSESQAGSTAETGRPVGGFWSDAAWLDYRDGKKRPIQPGLSPMVDGSPNHMGLCRAYGNAIVAPVAQAFIEAYLESTQP